MRIHREGYPTLIGVGFVLAIVNLFASRGSSGKRGLLRFTFPLSVLIWGFFARFFRNPVRHTPDIPNTIFAPADGTIVDIQRVHESEYYQDERLKISIYMSVNNVHLNRVPVSGKVKYVKYHAGKYLVAFHPKASELNERCTVVIEDTHSRDILVRQIAGMLARRIVTYMQVGEAVQAGEELGFIKFGSRCDVFLPVDAQPLVALNDRVRGGETHIARL